MKIQRWAVIGTGQISKSFVPDLQAVEGVEVASVHSRTLSNAQTFAKDFGIPQATDNYQEILADQTIEVLYLATPFATHFDMAAAAIRAGKHLLVEKPMALNAHEVAELFVLAREHGVFLMEAMWFKFSEVFIRLHDEIERGTIGEVNSARASFGIPFPTDGNASKWDLARSGGALPDQGIYPLTLAHSLFGEPQDVYARGVVREDGLDLAEHFTLEYADGKYVQCASSMVGFTELTASVNGNRGWLTLSPPFWATTDLHIHAGGLREIFRMPKLVQYERAGNGYQPMIRAVVAAISDGKLMHPVHTPEDTEAVFRTIDRIFAALR